MPSKTSPAVRNRLLQALPEPSFDRVHPYLERVTLAVRDVLVEPDVPTVFVHFLDEGLASMVASSSEGRDQIEVGHIGREGMSGFHVLHGVDATYNRTFMQVAGAGHRLAVTTLRALCEDDPVLHGHLLRYIHTYETQLAHSTLANARYSVCERLARWLLMAHDRIDGDNLPLTHEFLALMLGVRRAGVTNEIHVLEGRHLIKASRARIEVRDRAGLERVAGGCYGLPEREYELAFGRGPKGQDAPTRHLTGKQILVVEDDYDLAIEMGRELGERGAAVLGPVPSVHDALALLTATPTLDAAVVDINLRGEMAFPLADALRRRDVPFVFLSAYQRTIVPEKFADVRFYNKPVDADDLALALVPAT